MPKAPITYREGYFTRTRSGTIRFLNFASVNTELGAMIEVLPKIHNGDDFPNESIPDTDFNKISEIDEDKFFSLTGQNGATTLVSFT